MNQQSEQLLVNLSMLIEKPTGITNYVNNILPYLEELNPTKLIAKQYSNNQQKEYYISSNLSPDSGTKGHFLRLAWTQFQLPNIYQKLKGNLLFSPVPEAPLFNKCNFIIMVHDLIPLRFPKKNSPLTPYFRYYIPEVCRQAEHIICNSQATADDIINYFHISASKITPILLGYDQQKFRLISELKNNNSNSPYFLYLGRHDPHKNVPKIVKAFAQFKYNKDYQLWLAGPTDSRYTPQIKQQVKELGIDSQVKILDYISAEDLPLIINQATALIFPTLWEGFGFPVLEAMACGTPVITSNISSLPEVAGDACLLVNPENEQEIINSMLALVENNQLISELRDLGLKRASQFSWEKTGKKTLEVIKNNLVKF